jgi:hypothetical protein
VLSNTRLKNKILLLAAWLWLHFQMFSVVLPLPHAPASDLAGRQNRGVHE